MAFFKSATYYTAKGSHIQFETSAWDGEFSAFSITNDTRETLDVTHTRSPNGYMEFVPAGFTSPGTIEVTLKYDPTNPPPTNADPEGMQMVMVKKDSTDRVILSGEGFLTEGGGGELPEGGALGTSTFTIQKTGPWTLQEAEPAEAL